MRTVLTGTDWTRIRIFGEDELREETRREWMAEGREAQVVRLHDPIA